MTVQVTAPAKRLALPDPLVPLTVEQAPDDTNLDPLRVSQDDRLTAVIPTVGLRDDDHFYIIVKGEEGAPDDASYMLGPVRLGGVRPRKVNLRKSIVALLLEKKVTLTYKVVRDIEGPGEEKTSDPRELEVSALEVKEPVARILEAQGNGHGNELDLTTGTRNLTARLERWPLLAAKQLVWVILKGKDAKGGEHNLSLLAPPEGTVSERWESLGYHELPIDRSYLAGLGHDTKLTIEHRVAFDREDDKDKAFAIAERTYTVKAIEVVKPEITSVKDSAGNDVHDGNTTTDTKLTLSGTVADGKTVEILVGDTWRKGTTTDRAWTYEASGLTPNTYAFKARIEGSMQESNIWTVTVQAVEVAPVITGMKDSAGQDIADKGITTDTTLILRGTVESGKTVEIHDGDTWRKGTTTGTGWTYEASGLTPNTYAFKARIEGSTLESNTWTVTVQAAEVAPVITGMKDSAGQDIADKGITTDTTLILRGTVESGKTVEVHDGDTWRKGTTTGTGWMYEASGLTPNTYAFKARIEGSTPESNTWTVTVETVSDGKLLITRVIDALGNEVFRGGATTLAAATTITLEGTAVPKASVSVSDVFDLLDTETARESGRWTMTLSALTQKSYNFAISASGVESPALWPLAVMANGTPIIGSVRDEEGQAIPPYGETYEQTFTLSGQGAANGEITVHELLSSTREIADVDAQGRWSHKVNVGATPREYHYVASAPEAGSVKSNLWRVRVVEQP